MCIIYVVTALAWWMQTLFIRDKWKLLWHNYGKNNKSAVWATPWLIIHQGGSMVLGLTRLSLRGFPLALVRQIPLSASPLAIFIHKLLALRKTSNQEYNERSTSSLRNVNLCIDEANSHFLSPAYGGSGGEEEEEQREAAGCVRIYACVCVCVSACASLCVSGHFVVSHPLDPGPSTWGLYW